jgi:8-oxo-dGTP diphosphatase
MTTKEATAHYAADLALIALTGPSQTGSILLIQRSEKSDAHPGEWAIPGGYVDAEETSRSAAIRELHEETGIGIDPGGIVHLVGVYDDPWRDPRARVVSVAYMHILDREVEPLAADDAQDAEWVPFTSIRRLTLAFDHNHIVSDIMVRLGYGHLRPMTF